MPCDRIAGAHRLYYMPFGATSATYLGQTGEEGMRQIREVKLQAITSDEYGPEAVVDHVFQGQNLFLEFVVQEVNKDIVQMLLHPFQSEYTSTVQTSVAQHKYGVVGRLGCQVYGTLEAIPVAHSSASAFTGGSATGVTGVYPGTPNTGNAGRRYKGLVTSDISESMDGTGRFVPVRFQAVPFDDSGTTVLWQWISTYTAG